jgi:hypothetical protein
MNWFSKGELQNFLNEVIFQKVKFKIKRWSDFRGFQFPKVRKINKNHQISIFGFQSVTKTIYKDD